MKLVDLGYVIKTHRYERTFVIFESVRYRTTWCLEVENNALLEVR